MSKKDLTNQELLEAIRKEFKQELKGFATKEDLKAFATKDDLEKGIARLERQIVSSRRASTQHHLTTRKLVSNVQTEINDVREGLTQAAGTTR